MASEVTATEAPVAPYARNPSKHTGNVRRWVIGGVLGGLLIVMLGFASHSSGVLDRVLKRGRPDATTYIVRPVDMSITLTEDGEIKPKNSVKLKCEVEGQSTLLWVVEESKRVKKGDLLVELADETLKERIEAEEIELSRIRSNLEAATEELEITKNENASKLKKAQIELKIAELDIKKYLEGDYKKALKAIEISIKQTELDIKQKQEEVDKNRNLVERGFVTKSKLEQLEFALQKAQLTREQHLLSKQILEDYEKTMNLTQKSSAVERAREELEREQQRARSREKQAEARLIEQRALLAMREGRLDRLKEQRAKCKIYAPVDGLVQYPGDDFGWRSDRNRISPGERVFESQTLIVLPDTSRMVVETRIHEADRHKVYEGQECLVTVAAVPGRTFRGKVTKITRFADSANRWLNPELKEHTTEILLEETDATLSPGDSAEVKILIEQLEDVLAVPVQCVYSRGSRSFVFGRRGGRVQPIEVKLGRSSTTMVEVTAGLSAGDAVLTRADDKLLAMLPASSSARAEWEGSGTPQDRATPAKTVGRAADNAKQPAAADAQRPAAKKGSTS